MTTLHQACDGFERAGVVGRRPKPGSRLGKLGRLLAERAVAIRRDILVRREIAALDAMGDHILQDIGIPRSRIPDVARANVERYLERESARKGAE
ncbi:MAG: hypothetical protein R3316_08380 [Rhodovibrionaceae bacterium]|nr:hypothetical protein [Rhodovibrionaceae bacterium]